MFSDSPPTPEDVAAWKADAALREAHYAAIGRVAANWAYLEYEIDRHCIELGGLTLGPAACLTAQIAGPGRKLDAYIAIADLYGLSSAHAKLLHKFAKDAQGVAERRNRTVHDPWFLVAADTQARRFEVTAKRHLVFDLVHHPTPKVSQLASDIEALTERFGSLAKEVRDARDARWHRNALADALSDTAPGEAPQ